MQQYQQKNVGSRPELKVEDETGFISFFHRLPKDDNGAIRVFERNDFYTVHGADALFVAQEVTSLAFSIILSSPFPYRYTIVHIRMQKRSLRRIWLT